MSLNPSSIDPELVSIGKAAKILAVSVDTIRRWATEGRIASTRSSGGHRLFNRTELEKMATNEENLVISKAADFLGVSASTIRRYEAQGLIHPKRTVGGSRIYAKSQLEQLKQGKKKVEEVPTSPNLVAATPPASVGYFSHDKPTNVFTKQLIEISAEKIPESTLQPIAPPFPPAAPAIAPPAGGGDGWIRGTKGVKGYFKIASSSNYKSQEKHFSTVSALFGTALLAFTLLFVGRQFTTGDFFGADPIVVDSSPLITLGIDITEIGKKDGAILGLSKDSVSTYLEVNAPAFFTNHLQAQDVTISGGLTLEGLVTAPNVDIDLTTGRLFASNVVNTINNQSGTITLTPGAGITIDDSLTISATTVDSLTNFKVGTTTTTPKTLTVAAGDNITVALNKTSNTLTIASTSTTYEAGNDINLNDSTFELQSTLDTVSTINFSGTGKITGLDEIDDTTETTLEAALDASGDLSGTLTNLVIGNDKVTEAMLKVVDTAADEECLTYETMTGDFEWASCGAGGFTSFTVAAESGSSQTITDGNTLTITAGTGIDTVASATDTITVSVQADSIEGTELADALTLDTSSLVFDDGTNTLLTLTDAGTTGNLTLTGDLTISGNDLVMGTNTSGMLLIADGTDFNPTAVTGDVTITSGGVTAIGADKVTEAMLKVISGDTAADEECLTYESTAGDFEWQSCEGTTAYTNNPAGLRNEAFGDTALNSTDGTANDNAAFGYAALTALTTGDQNVAIGSLALDANTTASNNTAIGYNTLGANTTGALNVAIGAFALNSNTTAVTNTAIGYNTLGVNITGNNNVALGTSALDANTDASNSTAIGYDALGLSTGANNTALGYQAGNNITSGANNLIIGYDIDAPSATASNQLNIGNLIFSAGIDGTGTTVSTGNLGIGITNPAARLTVDGAADSIQFLVQGNATQTTNLFVAEQSDGTDVLTVTNTGNTTILGDLTITGDDLVMATNTSGAILVADGTNFNPVVMGGDATVGTTGTLAIAANAVALGPDTTNNYVATIADAGNSTVTVTNSGSETAAVTLDVIDVNCTDCLSTTEIADSYLLNTGDTSTGNITITKADPAFIFDTTTATDTDFWVGVTEDAGSDDDDLFQIGDGTTPGTNPFISVTTAGKVGIGTSTPSTALEVFGQVVDRGNVWTARSAAEANTWRSVTYGNGLFVAVAQDGTNRVMTSPDGITWTARSAAEANQWVSVAYGNGLFVAVAQNGTNRVMTSPDGITWTARSAAEANQWASVAYGNGLFVAVASDGTNRVMTSPDGITWTARSAAEANQWASVAYGNGLFVAVAQNGTNQVMTSPDGISWTARSAAEANTWLSVTYGNGLFVAVAYNGTNRVMTSPDGITWTARSAAEANEWYSVTYGNGLFVAVAQSGTNRVMTSSDGITWTARSAAEANTWYSVTYGNGRFVAVAAPGTNRVMTSGTPDINALAHNNTYQGGMQIMGNVGIGTTTPEALLEIQGIEATDAVLALDADDGDDAADTWFIKSLASNNSLSFLNDATEVANLTSAGSLQIDGDLTITGDDLVMATNTSGAILVADGTNFNPVVMGGDATVGTTGTLAIAANAVALTTDTTGDYVATITAGSGIATTGATSGEGIAHSISVSGVGPSNITDDSLDFIDFEDALDLDAATSITGIAGRVLTVTRTLTDATAENALTIGVTALDTTSGTTAQYGISLTNAASTEGLDALLYLNNADTDDSVADGIRIQSDTGTILTGLDFDDTDIVTDIELQNDETISNNTDGTIAVTAPSVTVSGDLTITGDDLVMATNTSGAILVADGTNFNPVVMGGDATVGTTGTLAIAANAVALTTDTTGDYVATITAGSGIATTGATSGEGIAHSISVSGVGPSNITDDSLDFIDFEDALDLDAATDINLGANLLSIDLDSTGDFAIRDGTTNVVLFEDDSTIDVTFPAAGLLTIDASTTANTTTAGVLDLNVNSVTANNIGLNIDYIANDGITAADDLFASKINLTQNDANGDLFGLQIASVASANAGANSFECLLCLTNAEDTSGTLLDAIRISDTSSTAGAIATAIDIDSSNVTTDIELQNDETIDNNVNGTIALTAPSVTISGDLTITGDDLVMTTNTSGMLLIADGTNFNPTAVSGDITINSSGATTIGADKVLESHLKAVDSATDEECLTYETTTGDFEWQSCASGSFTSFTVAAESGSSQTISDGNTLTITAGTGIDTVASATDTVTVSVQADSIEGTELADAVTLDTSSLVFDDGTNTLLTLTDDGTTGNLALTGDLTITGGDLTFGTSLILSGGDLTSLNLIDAIDSTTEATLEDSLDITGGDITSTGLSNATIGADKVLESHLKAVDAASDEECLTYETTTGDFEWQSCGGATATLQDAYGNDADGSDAIIALTTADDSLEIDNPAASGTDSAYAFFIDQNDTTGVAGIKIDSEATDTAALYILSAADGTNSVTNAGIAVTAEDGAGAAYFYSNIGAAQDDSVVEIVNDNTAADKAALYVQNDGGASSRGVEIINNSTNGGMGLRVESASVNSYAVYITGTDNTESINALTSIIATNRPALYAECADAGAACVQFRSNDATHGSVNVANDNSTGTGLLVTSYLTTGIGLDISESQAPNTTGRLLRTAHTSTTGGLGNKTGSFNRFTSARTEQSNSISTSDDYDLVSISRAETLSGNGGFQLDGAALYVDHTSTNSGAGTLTDNVLIIEAVNNSKDTNVLRLQDTDGTCDHNPESGSETVSCSSDIRLKTDVRDAGLVMDDLMKLKIRDYTVIASGDTVTGLIAQEALNYAPELVSQRTDGILMVDQISSWKIVKGLQELQYQILNLSDIVGTNIHSLEVKSSDDKLVIQAMSDRISQTEERITTLEEQTTPQSTGIVAGTTTVIPPLTADIYAQDLTFSGAITIDNNVDVTGELTVQSDVTLYASLVVDTVHVADALAVYGDANFLGNVTIAGRLTLSDQQTGTAYIHVSEQEAVIIYTEPYSVSPAVQVTPFSQVGSEWWVAEYSATGFTIRLAEAAAADVVFSWTTLGTVAPIGSVDSGADEPVVPVAVTEPSETDTSSIPEPTVVAEAAVGSQDADAEPVVDGSSDASFNVLGTVTVQTGEIPAMNLRAEPSITSDVLVEVTAGTTLAYDAVSGGWYRVQLIDGTIGWLGAEYLIVTP